MLSQVTSLLGLTVPPRAAEVQDGKTEDYDFASIFAESEDQAPPDSPDLTPPAEDGEPVEEAESLGPRSSDATDPVGSDGNDSVDFDDTDIAFSERDYVKDTIAQFERKPARIERETTFRDVPDAEPASGSDTTDLRVSKSSKSLIEPPEASDPKLAAWKTQAEPSPVVTREAQPMLTVQEPLMGTKNLAEAAKAELGPKAPAGNDPVTQKTGPRQASEKIEHLTVTRPVSFDHAPKIRSLSDMPVSASNALQGADIQFEDRRGQPATLGAGTAAGKGTLDLFAGTARPVADADGPVVTPTPVAPVGRDMPVFRLHPDSVEWSQKRDGRTVPLGLGQTEPFTTGLKSALGKAGQRDPMTPISVATAQVTKAVTDASRLSLPRVGFPEADPKHPDMRAEPKAPAQAPAVADTKPPIEVKPQVPVPGKTPGINTMEQSGDPGRESFSSHRPIEQNGPIPILRTKEAKMPEQVPTEHGRAATGAPVFVAGSSRTKGVAEPMAKDVGAKVSDQHEPFNAAVSIIRSPIEQAKDPKGLVASQVRLSPPDGSRRAGSPNEPHITSPINQRKIAASEPTVTPVVRKEREAMRDTSGQEKTQSRLGDGANGPSEAVILARKTVTADVGFTTAGLPHGAARVTSPMLADFLDEPLFAETQRVGAAPETRIPTMAANVYTPTTHRAEVMATLRQVAEGMARLSDGAVEIRLSPEELGQVRMQLVTTEAGMTVHVSAERPETLDLMRRHIEQLARDLADAGFEGAAFNFSGGDSDQGGDHPKQGPDAAKPRADDVHLANDPTMSPAVDGLDIRI